MTTLPNMGLVLPTRGAAGAGQWKDTIDDNYALEDAHDHSPGKGARINTDGISIDADLTFSSLYAPTNLHRLTFASIVALTSNNKSLFVSDADNELYWRSNTGTNVKLTLGNALNVAAFTGGIGGDYASVGAAVAYDDANDRYTFKQQGGTWARMASGEVRILETGSSETVYVGLAAPAALAGSYSITLPTTAPGSTSLVQLDSSGVLTASNTVANAVSMSSTLGVTGLITATGGVTAAANQHITVSGTGDIKHGDRILNIAPHSISGPSVTTAVSGAAIGNQTSELSVLLRTGDRIKSVTFARFGDGACDVTVTVFVVSNVNVQTNIGSTTVTNAPAAWADTAIDVTDTIIASTDMVVIQFAAGAGSWSLGSVRVTYDHP